MLLRTSSAVASLPGTTVPPRTWVIRGLLTLAIVATAAFFLRDPILGTPVEVREVARRDLVQTVVASGRVTTPQRVSVGAVITETVAKIPVAEGQAVKRGDVLIQLDDSDERAAAAQAQAAIAQAEAKLLQLAEVALPAARQSLVQAEANLQLARRQFERNRDLKTQGYISQSALDDSQRNLDVATSQLDTARLQVQANLPSGADVRMAQTALAQARAGLAAANARLEQTVIRAPADGVLIGRQVERGDVVQPGKELMVLAPAGETQIVVQIDEKHLSRLAPGQHAQVSADAYPHERFAAELFYINPGVDALRGSVEVKLRASAPPAYLRQDMTVSVDIEVARRAATLVVPADTLLDAASAHPSVLAIVDGRATKKAVVLGIRGDSLVEVRDGVVEGDRLIPVTSGVVPGQRVRVISSRAGAS